MIIEFRAWDREEKKMVGWGSIMADFVYYYANINFVLMQYTGRGDKAGKNIYKGDIVSLEGQSINYEVKWDENDASFYLECLTEENPTSFVFYDDEDIEILGNIHQNPELIAG